MKKLFVLRHAKSSWGTPGVADFDRPLNDRGLSAAPFIGSIMGAGGLVPEVILSSPANRARQTAELAKCGGNFSCEIRFRPEIYEASVQGLCDVLSLADTEFSRVMIVGHNPGMEGLVRFLTGADEDMPTAALAVIDLDIDQWSSITAGCGRLLRVIRPKEMLKDAGNI